eukprot:3370865-Rhodomonas_salina.2
MEGEAPFHESAQRSPAAIASTRRKIFLAASTVGVAVVCTALALQNWNGRTILEEPFYAPKPWHPAFRTNPTPLDTLPSVSTRPQPKGQQDFYPTA